jgi:hypothetical protein
VVDPPPILQLHVECPGATFEELDAILCQPFSVVHCTLWDPVLGKNCTQMQLPTPSHPRQQRRLAGTLVPSPFIGLDLNGIKGCFFPFPDLLVRTPGIYSLQFSLIVLDPSAMGLGNRVNVEDIVTSDVFTVFGPKDFPGMRPSTELTKLLEHQGCLTSVTKGGPIKATSRSNSREPEGDSGSNSCGEPATW